MVLATMAVIQQQTSASFKTIVQVATKLDYLISIPEGYADSKTKWPVILFLHGSGERGSTVQDVTPHGVPKEIANGRKIPAIVISPQCPDGDTWTSQVQIAALTGLLNDIEKRFRVDKDREYLTGLSMGGYGTWKMAGLYPDRFAAIAPVCGVGDPLFASKFKMPIWACHGVKDPAVPFDQDQKMIDAVKAAGGNVRFDVIPEGGHDVWSQFYAADEFYSWLLSQSRKN
ncbi:prolyl oligopeptidase family serine peptidase [soil metagenome]